jgi:hypothetical protein
MSKIIEIQPGVVFVPSDWGSMLVRAYDTRTITVSLGTQEPRDEEKENKDQLPSQVASST